MRADYDDLRRRNHALAIACERFRALYEQTPTPQLTIAPGGVIVDLNEAASILLCPPGRDLLATRVDHLVDILGRERFRAFIDDVFATGRARCGDVVLGQPGEPRVVVGAHRHPEGVRERLPDRVDHGGATRDAPRDPDPHRREARCAVGEHRAGQAHRDRAARPRSDPDVAASVAEGRGDSR